MEGYNESSYHPWMEGIFMDGMVTLMDGRIERSMG